MIDLRLGDCLEVMKSMPDNSVDAIVTDPPYYKVKGEAWDRQWDTADGFITWIGELCEQWERILKPNGSLYVFASPRMAARVEVEIGRRFNVLNRICWRKKFAWNKLGDDGKPARVCEDNLRRYYDASEYIIFAEHYGADNIAKGEAGYVAKCDDLRGFVFEPLRAYLDSERIRAGLTPKQVTDILGTQMYGHYFTQTQWELPTEEYYLKMRDGFHRLNHGGEYLRREYEDLRREYEDLRREYEDLRRPFSVTADVPYTDVWNFATVSHYPGKHPCEKPAALIRHIITASTRPGAVVLDCFAGSGVVGIVCKETGRDAILIEKDTGYFKTMERRIAEAQAQPQLI